MDDVTLFDSDVGKHALQFAWDTYAGDVHIHASVKHLLYTLLFTLSLFLFDILTAGVTSSSSAKDQFGAVLGWMLVSFSLVAIFYQVYKEFQQFLTESQGNVGEHFSDMWNVVDAMIHTTYFMGSVMRIGAREETDFSRNTLSVCAMLMYFKFLYFLRAFEQTGPLVAMIFTIARDIIPFLIVLFIVLFGFTQAFWIISYRDPNLNFGIFDNALLQSFDFMLGKCIRVNSFETSTFYAYRIL